MNYPIPTHLKSIFRVNERDTDSSNLSGSIVCDCGCVFFQSYTMRIASIMTN